MSLEARAAVLVLAMLAGACPPARGQAPVTPLVLAAVEKVLAEEAAEGPWHADDGMCLDLAAKWHGRLTALGLRSRIAVVDPARGGGTALVEGRRVRAGKFHAFLVVGDESGEDEVILDAAYRQFFAPGSGAQALPPVLVSRRRDVPGIFAERRAHLRIELEGDPWLGRYDPDSFAELVYGYGPNAELRELLEAAIP